MTQITVKIHRDGLEFGIDITDGMRSSEIGEVVARTIDQFRDVYGEAVPHPVPTYKVVE